MVCGTADVVLPSSAVLRWRVGQLSIVGVQSIHKSRQWLPLARGTASKWLRGSAVVLPTSAVLRLWVGRLAGVQFRASLLPAVKRGWVGLRLDYCIVGCPKGVPW